MKRLLAIALLSAVAAPAAAADAKPFVGNWALTIPGGAAGWLGVTETEGVLNASILWGGGSVVPVSRVRLDGNTLILSRGGRARREGHTRQQRQGPGDRNHQGHRRRRSDDPHAPA